MSQAILAADPISPRLVFYHRERLRNRVFDRVLMALAERVRRGQVNQAILAKRLDRDPAQISRWFSGPSNWTIDTISDLMLALETELLLDHCLYEDIPSPNYQHPLADAGLSRGASSTVPAVLATGIGPNDSTGSGTAGIRTTVTIGVTR